jgi:SAM-dependent methyltransferase
VPSRYDDELWALVPEDPGPPPAHLTAFVRGLVPVGCALDLGCGDGRLAGELQASELLLADVSDVALERAARRRPGARTVALTPDAPLPLADGTVDLVLCAETLEHVRDVQALLSECRRVLRTRGVLAVTTPAHGRGTALRAAAAGFGRVFDPLSPHLRFFSPGSLGVVLDGAGFDVAALRRERGSLLATAVR